LNPVRGTKLKTMKNIHKINNNIYITSDLEIKEGDWYLFPLFKGGYEIKQYNSEKHFAQEPCISLANLKAKKIILTTDQSLEGVQAIDDEFLEWFVKNPSCENVEVIPSEFLADKVIYEIIIPQEESKQPICEHIKEYGCIKDICTCNTGPKQETLEQAVKRFTEGHGDLDSKYSWIEGFEKGAKWQAERMYSEDDMEEAFENGLKRSFDSDFDRWFEQFKKK
jgi:hypothetical protein